MVSMIFIISFCFFRGKWFSFTYCVMCSKGVLFPLETLSKSHLDWSLLAMPFFHSVVILQVTQSLRSLTLPPHCPDVSRFLEAVPRFLGFCTAYMKT